MKPEQRIKEERMVEATRKNYMGLNGKLGCILQTLGQPIKSHGSPLFETSYLYDPYEDDDDLPTFSEDDMTTDVGYLFDGLSRGIHLEIKFLDNVLSVSYKGRIVYKEVSGDLEAFHPYQEWESQVDRLYNLASKLQRETKKEIAKTKKITDEIKKKMWLQELWDKWGFKI